MIVTLSRTVREATFIFLLTILTYSPSLTADFTFDDRPAILENNDVTDEVISSSFTHYLHRIFQHDFWGSNITDHSTSHKSYRPLTVLTFKLDHLIQKHYLQAWRKEGTTSPILFHTNNILLHALNSVLFYAFVDRNFNVFSATASQFARKLCAPPAASHLISFTSAIIFSIHPVHTESIAGVVGRADLLYSFFVLLALLINHYISSTCKHLLIGSLAVLSVLSKEQGIILLPLLIIHRILMKLSSKKDEPKLQPIMHFIKKTEWKIVLSYACGLLLILYGRLWIMDFRAPTFQEGDNPTAFINSSFQRFLNYSYIYWLNLWILLSPNWLCFDWSMGCLDLVRHLNLSTTFQSQTAFKLLSCLSFWTLTASLFLRAIIDVFNLNQNKILKLHSNKNTASSNSVTIIYALTLLILPFIPASNIFFTVGFVVAERNLYLSVGGFALLIAIGYEKISIYLQTRAMSNRKLNARNLYIVNFCLFFLITMFISKSISRSYEWKNEDILYRSGLSVCPKNSKIHYNIAKLVQRSQEQNNMDTNYNSISNLDVDNLLKLTSFDWTKDTKELQSNPKTANYRFINPESLVVMLYRTSIYLWPEYEHALNNLANVLRKRPQKTFHLEAKDLLKRALKINSKFSAAWMNLGIVQAQLDELKSAESCYFNAISLRNNFYPDGHFNLGTLYLKFKDKKEEALTEFSISIAQNELHFSAWSNKVILLDELNRLKEAQEAATRAKTIFPKKAEFYFHLGNILGKRGEFDKAEENYHQAINLINSENPPKNPKIKSLYHSNLGVLYHRWKKEGEAIKFYKEALFYDNKNANARDNLNRLLKAN